MIEPELRTWHYQVWCALCLGVIFVAQLSQGIFLTNLLAMLLGLLAVVSRLRWGVLFLIIGVGFAQSLRYFMTERHLLNWTAFGRDLDLHDFLLALGMLGFVVGQQRLQGIWHHLWPPDPRERGGPPRRRFPWFRRRPPVIEHRRREVQLRPVELVTLSFFIPVVVLAGTTLFTLTRPPRDWLGLPLGLGHFLILLWIAFLIGWIVRHVLELWHVWSFAPTEARVFLQDQVWTQLRGEQRRIARWKAWRK